MEEDILRETWIECAFNELAYARQLLRTGRKADTTWYELSAETERASEAMRK